MKLDFTGQVVLVTGAAQGNGAAIARGFAEAGARVALADRNEALVSAMAAKLAASGHAVIALGLDVSDHAACIDAAAKIEGQLGTLNVLVNNAGILIRGKVDDGNALENWNSTINVNLSGPFNVTMACLSQLKRNKGCILNLGSIQSFVATPNSIAYTASKGGVAQLTKAMAYEFAEHGIRVNAIAPGVIETPMTVVTLSDPAKLGALLAHVPMRRHGQADELIGPALFLCSRAASYVTGVILPVDGGYLAA